MHASTERLGHRLVVEDLPLDDGFGLPLSSPTLRCLQYMHDIEQYTVCYLRELLLTDAHEDPDVTEFLTLWNFEEHWHGEAIARVLTAHGWPAGPERVREVLAAAKSKGRLRPLVFFLGNAVLPELVTVSMTWGMVNELTTQAGYGILARREGHPLLSALLGRIMRQEGGHIAFYTAQARARLEASPRARRVTRLALQRLWKPVGHGVRPVAETDFVVRHLFSSPEGREAAARIDRNIARLPGLEGLHPVTSAVDRVAGQARLAA
jgi:hypothetical protein